MFMKCLTWVGLSVFVVCGAFAVGFSTGQKRQPQSSRVDVDHSETRSTVAQDESTSEMLINDPILRDILEIHKSPMSGTTLEQDLINDGKSVDGEFFKHLSQVASLQQDLDESSLSMASMQHDDNYSAILRNAANALLDRAFQHELRRQFEMAEDLERLAKQISVEADGHEVEGQSD